jgi:phosphatidylethanolamine-binding protein (PEBP) family uncharacterized protein
MSFEIASTAFSNGGMIPKKFTCDGPDASPPLKWTGAPAATKNFALIMDDPDAPVGTWVHWVLYTCRRPSYQREYKNKNSSPTGRHKAATIFAASATAVPVLLQALPTATISSCMPSTQNLP